MSATDGQDKAEEKTLTDHRSDEELEQDSSEELTDSAGSGRRKLLMRVAIVLIALVVLVGIPAYLTSGAGFFAHVPAVSEEHEAWETSTHLGAGCSECHSAPGKFSQASYRVRMVGEFYLSLVLRSRTPRLFDTPVSDACLACHSDLRTVSPRGDLQIPHRAHVTILEMPCVDCHNYLVHELSPEGKHVPPMVECLECHDGDTAKDSCTACHTEKASPETHSTEDWVIVHAERSDDDPECISCHKWADDWCADCHSHRPPSHGTDWRPTHGGQVEIHRSCEACHEGPFCVECHGEVPQLNYDPALRLVE